MAEVISTAFLENVISGVVANGLTAILTQIALKGRELGKKRQELNDALHKDPGLNIILQRATASVTRTIADKEKELSDELRIVLSSPEIDAIVRQVFSNQLTKERNGQLDSIRLLFIETLSLRLGKSLNEIRDFASSVFDAIYTVCDKALTVAIESGILAGHEAKSASRHRLILNELAVIKKNLAYLEQANRPNIQSILSFEEKYRQQVKNRHAHITPPNFDSARKLAIDDIYVSPDFESTLKRKGQERDRLKLPDFLNIIYRTVLLGNPGGGKSTFANKACYDLATRYVDRLVAGRQLTPILVVLRDYGAEKKTRNCSILQFIELTANSHYQTLPPEGGFEYLLLNGRVAIIFDGMDELLDTSYRREISSDIETFCSLYPAIPVLITSREVGYEQAPLDENTFETFRLSPFNEEQVAEYANKWFSSDREYSPDQQKQKTEAFLHESRFAPDLRSNPLMLGLMCNIYRGESYIPRNRPDIYEKCAVMLFERWDKMRGIHASLPFEAHIRPTMMFLAHWIYSEASLQAGVTERRLINKATDYLCPKRFEDRDEAERAATEFIEFCRGRAWVFTDTGTTKDGECLYQFTHRTFLEYFTAAHLFRTHPTAESLGALLLPRITKREWDVVSQLAFQIQNKNVEGAADQLLNKLLKEAQGAKGNKVLHLLSFTARCLEFLVPSPKTIRDITTNICQCCFDWAVLQVELADRSQKRGQTKNRAEPGHILGGLLSAATENRSLITDSLDKFFTPRLIGEEEKEVVAAVNIIVPLSFTLHSSSYQRSIDIETLNYWEHFTEKIFNSCWARISRFCPNNRQLAHNGFLFGKISLESLVEWHGVKALFSSIDYTVPQILLPSPSELLLVSLDQSSGSVWWMRHITNYVKQIEDAGTLLLRSPRPWISLDDGSLMSEETRFWYISTLRYRSYHERPANHGQFSAAEVFGIFCLLAPMFEANETEKNLIDSIKNEQRPPFNRLRDIFLARLRRHDSGQFPLELQSSDFTADQRLFVQRWIEGTENLVSGIATWPGRIAESVGREKK